jgi:Ca2+-transporting ATPase
MRSTASHHLSSAESLAELKSSPEGLSETEVFRRLSTYGPNELLERSTACVWKIAYHQLSSILLIVLIAAAISSATLGTTRMHW